MKTSLQWWNEYYFAHTTVYIEREDNIEEMDNDDELLRLTSSSPSSSSLLGFGFFGPIAMEKMNCLQPGEDTILGKRTNELATTAAMAKKDLSKGKKRKINGWDEDNTSTTGSRLDSSIIDDNEDDHIEDDSDVNNILHHDNQTDRSSEKYNDGDLLLELISGVRDGFHTSTRFMTMMSEKHQRNQSDTELLRQRVELLAFKLNVHVHILKAQTTGEESMIHSLYARRVWHVIKKTLMGNHNDEDDYSIRLDDEDDNHHHRRSHHPPQWSSLVRSTFLDDLS